MKIDYISFDYDECDIDFCVTDDKHYDYSFHGSNGDFICDILNDDYSTLYYWGPKYYHKIKEEIDEEKEFHELVKSHNSLATEIGLEVKEGFFELGKGPYTVMARSLEILKNLSSIIDLNEYKYLIDKILLNKDARFNTEQRFVAYKLITKKHDLCDFRCTTSIAPDIYDKDNIDTNHYGEILKLIKNCTTEEGFQIAKEYTVNNKLDCRTDLHYRFDDFKSLFNFILYTMIKNNDTIKKCKNCGRYFHPENRSDTIYCSNASPEDPTKSCQEYGAIKAYQENLKTNESAGLYRKIYMQKQMLCKRNPDIESYRVVFDEFKKQSKLWKSDIKQGIRTESDYLDWLKSIRRKEGDPDAKHSKD